jgi:SsrA-binding protein
MAKKKIPGNRVAQNRKARRNYEIEDKFESGIVLTGSEVKSLRGGRASINEAYAGEMNGELYLFNSYIPEYAPSGRFGHDAPRRSRKLLMHRREIGKLLGAVSRDGMTLVPLSLYFNSRGIAKVELALGRGKHKADKRQTIKERDWKRRKARLLRGKGG